jgi:hypothetical protein
MEDKKMSTRHVHESQQRVPAQKTIFIETLPDLNPHTDIILKAINADKRLALLAIADPVGVIKDLGFELSPQATRDLKHSVPRMSREQRDRYLIWLRGLGNIPNTLDIKLVNRPSGNKLLRGTGKPQEKYDTLTTLPGKGAAGFDMVAQFSEDLCNRILKRHYAFGNLPRSVYRIKGKLEYYHSSGEYETYRSAIGTSDREVHFGQPSLKFLTDKADMVRVTSPFVALGFAPQEIKGYISVDGKLVVKKDSKGQPNYIELTFDSVTNADISVTLTTVAPSAAVNAGVEKMMLDTYKNFHKFKYPEPAIPLTFTLVDSTELVGKGATVKVDATAGIRKPAGASTPLLLVGLKRSTSPGIGNLNAVTSAIKSGGDFALVQDSTWLEQHLNAGFIQALPVRFNPDSGQPDPNGDLRIDSIVWHYRQGGLTGDLSGVQDNAYLWISANLEGATYVDIAFHSSEPTLTVTGSSDLSEADCWGKLVFVLIMILVGVIVGGVVGALVGALVGGAIAAGAIIGGIVGGGIGLATALALVKWPFAFDTSGIPPELDNGVRSPFTQELKVTHTRTLPETGGNVTVVPNDFGINSIGTLMGAKVIGPNNAETQPSVNIKGAYSVDISHTASGTNTEWTSPGTVKDGALTGIALAGMNDEAALPKLEVSTLTGFESLIAGSISLHYFVDSTSGLQGKLSYLWTFNSKPVGTDSSIDVDIPITVDMIKSFAANQENLLGVVSVYVTDSFGRSASASAAITVGNVKDLRAFAPAIVKQPGYIDPIERVGLRSGELVSTVGWLKDGTDLTQYQGILVAYSTFILPTSSETYAIIGTRVG